MTRFVEVSLVCLILISLAICCKSYCTIYKNLQKIESTLETFFKKYGPNFTIFSTIFDQIKACTGVFGIRTLDRRKEGADESTALWRPPQS